MVSRRNPFLQREPWQPAVKPARGPRPPTRRPPGSRPRDPRTYPKYPSRKPKFTPAPRPPKAPFGKLPTPKPAHIPPGVLRPGLLKPLTRFIPYVGWGLLAWDAWQFYQWWTSETEPGWNTGPSDSFFCRTDKPDWPLGPAIRYLAAKPACDSTLGPPGAKVYDPSRPWQVRYEGLYQPWPFRRYLWFPMDGLRFTRPPGAPPDWQPEFLPGQTISIPIPMEVPYPYPFSNPVPANAPRPMVRPGRTHAQPQTQVGPGQQPAIELSPGAVPHAGIHDRRPPQKNEQEKKKRIKGSLALTWLNFIKGGIGAYTETDDLLAAMYKGLPWYLRRWRGRDGVWRDRDIRADTRAKRLYQHLGKLDVQKAITEVVKNQFEDAAFGKAGNMLKNRAKELGDAGLWTSSGGFQRGGSLMKDNWEDVYEKLQKDAAANTQAGWYMVREQQADGSWAAVRKPRPMTQIPWYKQTSKYLRRPRRGTAAYWSLTAAEKAARKKTVKGHYYAASPSERPLKYRLP